MSDEESEDDMNASYEVDNPDQTKDISLNDSVISENSDAASASFSSVASDAPALSASTPKKKRGRGNKNQPVAPEGFKVPKAPPVYLARCPLCQRALKTASGLNQHLLRHKWKDLAARKPNPEELLLYCLESHEIILQDIQANPSGGKYGTELNKYIAALLEKKDCKEWTDFVSKVIEIVIKFVCETDSMKGKAFQGKAFPSSLRSHLYSRISNCLSVKEKREDLLDSLFKVQITLKEIGPPFLLMFMQRMANRALLCVYKSMSGSSSIQGGKKRSADDFNSLKSPKLLHYIAGSCMRSHLRYASRYPQNARLQRVKAVIMNKFATSPPTVAEKKDKAYWTTTLNRKALFFVSDNAFPFFIELAQLVQGMELHDGSLDHEAVMLRVVNAPSLLWKWDSIIGSALDDEESFRFLVKVLKTLTNSYGVGVLLRRMGAQWKKTKGNKGAISVSHRARLLKVNPK